MDIFVEVALQFASTHFSINHEEELIQAFSFFDLCNKFMTKNRLGSF